MLGIAVLSATDNRGSRNAKTTMLIDKLPGHETDKPGKMVIMA
jgi:hypothetical protein